MYYFIDKNQTQQGPFSIEELLLQNDFNSVAFVWTKGMKDWKPAVEIDELREFLGDIPPIAPCNPNVIPTQQTNNANSNDAAIAGFILALATLIFFYVPIFPLITGILALVFSIVGICRKNRKYTGIGIAGTIISIIALAGTLICQTTYVFLLKERFSAWNERIEQYDGDYDYDYDWD
jgi:hypothetical protein